MEKTLCGFRLPLVYDEEADAIYADDVLVAELFADSPKLGHMIASAPELLEALGFAVEVFGDQEGLRFSQRHAIDKARAAIAKARGGEG